MLCGRFQSSLLWAVKAISTILDSYLNHSWSFGLRHFEAFPSSSHFAHPPWLSTPSSKPSWLGLGSQFLFFFIKFNLHSHHSRGTLSCLGHSRAKCGWPHLKQPWSNQDTHCVLLPIERFEGVTRSFALFGARFLVGWQSFAVPPFSMESCLCSKASQSPTCSAMWVASSKLAISDFSTSFLPKGHNLHRENHALVKIDHISYLWQSFYTYIYCFRFPNSCCNDLHACGSLYGLFGGMNYSRL